MENLFENNEGEICATILEPVVENGGFIAPKPEAVRKIIKENNALLNLKRLQEPGCYEYLDKIASELVQGIHYRCWQANWACDSWWIYSWNVWVFLHGGACLQLG
ncbi:hypothetical protein OIU79_029469 [Salix purpurea]|uniref:Uncharacterized protein n=1 Tax=Salix purpurea TaxID=77065 RepID=A0A9Q0ZVF0_SALPP|nr:hypothetical protein OIU79_029469 [Salix purpurea]